MNRVFGQSALFLVLLTTCRVLSAVEATDPNPALFQPFRALFEKRVNEVLGGAIGSPIPGNDLLGIELKRLEGWGDPKTTRLTLLAGTSAVAEKVRSLLPPGAVKEGEAPSLFQLQQMLNRNGKSLTPTEADELQTLLHQENARIRAATVGGKYGFGTGLKSQIRRDLKPLMKQIGDVEVALPEKLQQALRSEYKTRLRLDPPKTFAGSDLKKLLALNPPLKSLDEGNLVSIAAEVRRLGHQSLGRRFYSGVLADIFQDTQAQARASGLGHVPENPRQIGAVPDSVQGALNPGNANHGAAQPGRPTGPVSGFNIQSGPGATPAAQVRGARGPSQMSPQEVARAMAMRGGKRFAYDYNIVADGMLGHCGLSFADFNGQMRPSPVTGKCMKRLVAFTAAHCIETSATRYGSGDTCAQGAETGIQRLNIGVLGDVSQFMVCRQSTHNSKEGVTDSASIIMDVDCDKADAAHLNILEPKSPASFDPYSRGLVAIGTNPRNINPKTDPTGGVLVATTHQVGSGSFMGVSVDPAANAGQGIRKGDSGSGVIDEEGKLVGNVSYGQFPVVNGRVIPVASVGGIASNLDTLNFMDGILRGVASRPLTPTTQLGRNFTPRSSPEHVDSRGDDAERIAAAFQPSSYTR